VLSLVLPRGDKGDTGAGGGGSFSWASVPATSAASGTAGEIAYDSSYFYVCVASNSWRAAALSVFPADPLFSSVSLLLPADGTLADSSPSANTVSAFGNAAATTSTSKWGSGSIAFDGEGDYLTAPTGTPFNFGTGDFCVETWLYITALPASGYAIFEGLNIGGLGERNSTFVAYIDTTGKINIFSSNAVILTTTNTVPANQWVHVAIARDSGTLRVYIGGTRGGSVSNSTSMNTGACVIGRLGDSAGYLFSGWMDDYRITKGASRGYTGATITVPATAFPTF
jgi:hypothetical protein